MMVREYLKSVLHEIEEQRKANTAEIEEQRLEKETIDKKIARIQSKNFPGRIGSRFFTVAAVEISWLII